MTEPQQGQAPPVQLAAGLSYPTPQARRTIASWPLQPRNPHFLQMLKSMPMPTPSAPFAEAQGVSSLALALVLTAAVLHAAWNAMVKAGNDRALILACVAIAHTVVGAAMIAVAPAPAPASWPYIAASGALHYLYYILLFLAYRIGDLSQVYPIARGLSPLLVSIGAFLFAGELLSLPAAAGIAWS